MNLIQHFVNGKIVPGKSERRGKVFNPAIGEQESETDAKIKWLNKTKNSPAAKSGAFTDDERWEQYKNNNPDWNKKGDGKGGSEECSRTLRQWQNELRK